MCTCRYNSNKKKFSSLIYNLWNADKTYKPAIEKIQLNQKLDLSHSRDNAVNMNKHNVNMYLLYV